MLVLKGKAFLFMVTMALIFTQFMQKGKVRTIQGEVAEMAGIQVEAADHIAEQEAMAAMKMISVVYQVPEHEVAFL
jgi:hypothetical protein